MDHFGIGAGITAVVRTFFQAARATGRTTSLVESLKTGDRVVFLTEREGRRVQAMCKDRGVRIQIVVNDARNLDPLRGYGSPGDDGRFVFDHSWVEEFYNHTIERAQHRLDQFQRELSGYGEAHRETRRFLRKFVP